MPRELAPGLEDPVSRSSPRRAPASEITTPGPPVAPLGADVAAARERIADGRPLRQAVLHLRQALEHRRGAGGHDRRPGLPQEITARQKREHVAGEAVGRGDVARLSAVQILLPEHALPLVEQPVGRFASGGREALVTASLQHRPGRQHCPRGSSHRLVRGVARVLAHACSRRSRISTDGARRSATSRIPASPSSRPGISAGDSSGKSCRAR